MAFRFSLATVFRYRELLEQQALFAVETTQGEIARMRLQLIDLDLLRTKQQTDRNSALRQGVTAVEMEFATGFERSIGKRIEALNHHISAAEEKKRQQLELYREAHQNREVIEELRKNQREVYEQESSRREQARIDDLSQRRRAVTE